MRNVVVIEDSSINDLGGGQRITLKSIAILKEAGYPIIVIDLGNGPRFSEALSRIGVVLHSFNINGIYNAVTKFPSIFSYLKSLSILNDSLLYATTKKGYMLGFALNLIEPKSYLIFHKHSRTSWLFDILLKRATLIISPWGYGKNIDSDLRIIPNPVDIKRVKSCCRNVSSEKRVIGFIGGLTGLKGFDIFICALAKLKCKILIAGSGQLSTCIPDSPNVTYLGYLEEDEKLSFFSDVDVLVFPSVIPEPFSLVCFEALFNRIPVVCFNLGFPSEIIKKYNVGVVAEVKNSDFLVSAIDACLANIEIYSNNCVDVIKDFDNDSYTSQLLGILKKF